MLQSKEIMVHLQRRQGDQPELLEGIDYIITGIKLHSRLETVC